jgi:hypothetical protein
MSLILNGTDGLSDVDGTAATPAIRGTDTNTGIFFPAADTIAFSEGGTESMRIDGSGNLGIGTTTPAAKLVIDGGTSTDQMRIGNGSNYYSIGRESATTGFLNFYGSQTGANGYVFGGINGERMRIDSSGNLLVNSTSQSAAEQVGISFDRTAQQGLAIKNTSATSPSNATYATFYYTTTNTGSINSTGTTTSYGTTSDYRLKENIAPMTGALAKVQALKPVTYQWKVDGSSGQGFIAHELQEVVPDCVTGEKDGVETVDDVDADGKVIGTKEVPKYQGIDTSFLAATLTASIQELKAIVDAQAARIAALESAGA